jgi:hypothetical protein
MTNVVTWAHNLRMFEPEKYENLKTFATAFNLAIDEKKEEIKEIISKNIPLDEEFYKMVDYCIWLDDEADRLYKDCCERGGYFNL